MLTININSEKNMLASTSALLPPGKLRQAANGTITTTAFRLNEPVESVVQDSARFVMSNGVLSGGIDDKWWRTPKPKKAAPPLRLISISTDLFTILSKEGRAQA